MHEASVIQAVLEEAERQAQIHKRQAVEILRLRVGTLSGAVPEALAFAFEALKSSTCAAKANLEIEPIPARARCLECGHNFHIEDLVMNCPSCQSWETELLCGTELEMIKVVLS